MQVQLHDLDRVARARVRQAQRQVDRAVDRHLVGARLELAPRDPRVAEAVAEREGRRRVDVRHPRGARERRGQVRRRLHAAMHRDAHRQSPAGLDPPAEHAGDRRRALLAGEERLHDRGRAVDRGAEGVRPPRQHHEHGRSAGVEHGVEQQLLRAGKREVVGVAALAARAAAEQSGPVAEDDDGELRLSGGGDGLLDAVERPVVDAGAVRVRDVRRGELGAEGIQHAVDSDADRRARMLRDDVRRERVAAEHRVRLVGVRADDGHRGRSPQGQEPRVAHEHDRLLGELAGERPVLSRVEVDRPAHAVGAVERRRLEVGAPAQGGRHRLVVGVEQTEIELLREHAAERRVDEARVEHALVDRAAQRLAEGLHRRQLDVDAGLERGARGLGPGARGAVQQVQERDREVVGDDRAGEAPLLAQQLGEQAAVSGARHAVEVGVGVHDAARPALADGHLERRQQHVGELARPHRDGREVAPGARGGVADEVLERRDDAARLEPAHVGAADGGDEIRVFADGLLDATPAGVAHDVEHGGEALVDAHRAHVVADAPRHPLDEPRVEARAPREGHGVRGRAPGGEAGKTLLVRDGGDAEAALLDDAALGREQ